MIKESPTIAIKQDPEVLQEEQDDLILSYLNSDYVSTETTIDDPPSPPYSISSASTDAAPSMDIDMTFDQSSSPQIYMQDPFLFHLQTALNEQGMPLPWPSSTAALPTAPFTGGGIDTQDPSCLLNIHPLFMPSTNENPFLPQAPQSQTQQPQPHATSHLPPRSSSCSSTASSSSDSEQSKKKRSGRKKREVSIAPAPLKPLTRILPAAAATTTTSSYSPPPPSHQQQKEDCHHVVKKETFVTASLDQIPTPSNHQYQRSSVSSTTPNNNKNTEKSSAEIAYAKRQERLIKNRAAALLSRKRKREHLTTLEDERQQLVNENETLHSKVTSLEARVVSLEQENMELKRKLSSRSPSSTTGSSLHKQHHYHHHHTSLATPKHAKTTGMVFMIILFSFALFTLPSSHSSDQLTVGGGLTKPNIALIGSSPSSVPEIRLDIVGNSDTTNEPPSSSPSTSTSTASSSSNTTTADLMLIDHVRPSDLQMWIKEKLGDQQQQHDQEEIGLVQWRDRQPTTVSKSVSHLYLYANEFSQVTPLHVDHQQQQDPMEPTLSILCPLNQTTPCERPAYLQIDVKVMGSRVLAGELKHDQQHQWATATHGHDDTPMFDLEDDPADKEPAIIDRRRQLRRKTWMDGSSRISRVVLG
ncbi:unnamed protein product [Absidia cylindrospora]